MSDLTTTPASSRFGLLVERVRSMFTPMVQPEPQVLDPYEGLAPTAAAFTPWSSPAERIATEAIENRMDQVPYREFGADVMPERIAEAGIVVTYESAIERIERNVADRAERDRGEVLTLLQSSNISLGLVKPLGPTDPIERLAHEWATNGVGANAVDRMLGAASEVARNGEWPGRDTALISQPFGLQQIDARQEWERRVLEIDGTDLTAAEKAMKIEGLGNAPAIGEIALMDRDGVVYQRGSLDRAELIAEQDIDEWMNLEEYSGHNITQLATTDWITPEAGAEYRATFGQSPDGFHHLTEISYGGGDREEEWSDAYPSLAEAEAASSRMIDLQFYPERIAEIEREQEIGGHEL